MKRLNAPCLAALFFAAGLLTTGCAEGQEAEAPEPAPATTVALEAPTPDHAEEDNMQVPPAWTVRADRDREITVGANADSADIFFVTMAPGWHLTSGPAAIYTHPGLSAEGSYRAALSAYLFDPEGRKEGFGLLFGGQDLDAAEQSYVYFLIRQGGEFLVKRRMGAETETLIPWTSHEAIVSYPNADGGNAFNRLVVEVGADEVTFHVNDAQVASLPADGLSTDGLVGIRANHQVNLHITEIAAEPLEDTPAE